MDTVVISLPTLSGTWDVSAPQVCRFALAKVSSEIYPYAHFVIKNTVLGLTLAHGSSSSEASYLRERLDSHQSVAKRSPDIQSVALREASRSFWALLLKLRTTFPSLKWTFSCQ